MIDWERVAELQEEVGTEDFYEVVELFFEEVEEALDRLVTQNVATAESLHFLKGSALNLGFEELAALCKVAEQDIDSVDGTARRTIQNAYLSAKRELTDTF